MYTVIVKDGAKLSSFQTADRSKAMNLAADANWRYGWQTVVLHSNRIIIRFGVEVVSSIVIEANS